MATGTALNSLFEPTQNFATQTENEAILDFHFALEEAAHDANLNGTVHGLTDTGETFGLGKVGQEGTLITDVVQAPGNVLYGSNPQTEVSNIITDTGEVISGVGKIVQGAGNDLSNPDVVNDVVGAVTDGSVIDEMTNGAGEVANGVVDNLSDGLDLGDLGGLPNPGGLPGTDDGGNGGGSCESAISVSAGESGGAPILNTRVLTGAPGNAPIGIAAGSGENFLDLSVLDGSQGHVISADGGAPGNPIIDAGVLTTPDGQTPINVDVGNGTNIADASLLPNSDLLQFNDLGGAGTDSLSGLVPNLLGGGIGSPGDGTPACDNSLIEISTGCEANLLTTHSDSNSLLGLNDQVVI